ncbi:MAG: FAD-dependent oxidoreductase [Pigmentiphaga sp.]|uniref:FAD-dependent oxidoreductase n=1 Tax=Pigmentiphaga sp. TaxID=1977564 RepID=UPI0029ABB7C5|nr:FAD-dependent oxidoreductase [Pigmentiphaga sp.]MDX3904274.1 FAD-dependent oxidoreductase [Pigmentiphaga sp.]
MNIFAQAGHALGQANVEQVRADVVVVGAGAAGVCAALAAAGSGARTLLIDAGPMPGGELLTGMAVDGALNARGEWILGGVGRKLFDACNRLGGYIGPLNDWRLIHYVCFDPEVMKLAVAQLLARHGVELWLQSFMVGVEHEAGEVRAVHVYNKHGLTRVCAPVFVDASGDGDLVAQAGGSFDIGGEGGEFQPLSLMFRMSGVDTPALLRFLRSAPEHFALGESDAIRGGRSDDEIAQELIAQGQPTVFIKGDGPLLAQAIEQGRMYPTALIMIQPTSATRREVCLNTTRIANVNALQTRALGPALATLAGQVETCVRFMQESVPGFEGSAFSGMAPRIGVRETRRLHGDATLLREDVLRARKRDDGIGKGSHHVDIHQDGTGQIRIPVDDGGSYDIPWGCLLPAGLDNVALAGRCVSADRAAHGSVRVMGPCMAMGEAAGTAAAMLVARGGRAFRSLPVQDLRASLREAGAILDGTH